MVRILNNTEEDVLISSIRDFYNLSTCSQLCGNEVIINLSKRLEKVTYSDLRYTTFDKKEFRLYFRKERLLIEIMLELFLGFQEVYVFNLGDRWITNRKIAPSLNQILRDNKILDGDSCILLTEEFEIVAFVKSIFRYNTFASFFDPRKGVLVTPTDHLDIFISSKDDYVKTVKNIIESKNGSKIFHLTHKKY